MDTEEGEGNAELLALHRIDETCTRLQQQGNYLEALECMERGLVLRQHFFGPASEEVWAACKTVGQMCNLLAMTYLQQEDFPMVLELLKKAEILTERDDKGRAVTYNNLACYYRRQGKLHAALQYLQKAIKVEQQLIDVENRADTHLNLCAVLSQLGRHAGALEHAQSALILLQEELFGGAMGASGEKRVAGADRIAVLAIAYNNIGVENEFLKRYDIALESYRKGVEIAQSHLGENHGITQTLKNSFISAKKSISAKAQNRSSLGRHGRIGDKRNGRKGKKRGARAKSPEALQRDQQRWNHIQKAYGEVALGVKPKPIVESSYNLHQSGADDDEKEDGFAEPDIPRLETADINLKKQSTQSNNSNNKSNSENDNDNDDNDDNESKITEKDEDQGEEEQEEQSAEMNHQSNDQPEDLKEESENVTEAMKDMMTPRNESALEILENEKKDIESKVSVNSKENTEKEPAVPEEKSSEKDDDDDDDEEVEIVEVVEVVEVDDDDDGDEEEEEEEEQVVVQEEQEEDEEKQEEKEVEADESDEEKVDETKEIEKETEQETEEETGNDAEDEEKESEKLPDGWTKEFSNSKQKYYYFNSMTGQAVWSYDEIPTSEEE